MLHVGLALDGVGDALVALHVDQAFQAVAFCEAFNESLAVLVCPTADVGGHAGIERAVRPVGHDVDPAPFARSLSMGLVEGADMRYMHQIEFRPNDLASPRAMRRTDDFLPKSRPM